MFRPRWRAITTVLGISTTLTACGDDGGGSDAGDATAGSSTDAGTGGNAAPTPTDDAVSTAEDTALQAVAASGLLTNDTDPDGDPLTVSAFDATSVQAGTVTVDPDGGFTYTPAQDFNGDDSFTYTADDGQGGATVATVTITVGPVNDAPVAVDDQYIVADNAVPLSVVGPSGVLANDTDVDGDPLTVMSFDLTSNAGGTPAVSADGAFTYTPASPFWGEDLFGYVVDDGNGGMASGVARVIVSPTAVPLSAVTGGVGGFTLDGEAFNDFAGRSVSAAGDVNGDGLDDIIVGAFAADPNGPQSGRSYVVFGKADTTLVPLSTIAAGVGGFVLDGEAFTGTSGRSVSTAGDVNGDGLGDIIVGAPFASPNGAFSGRSYVVFGKADTTAVQLSAITAGMGGFTLDGEVANDQAGSSVSAAGDVNGDGLGDIVVGAYRADANGAFSGRSYVVFGKADTAAVPLSAVTAGTGGFVLNGEAANDGAGASLSAAGDVNGDGLGDIIVGAYGADPNGLSSGRSYVVFGKADTAAVQLSAVAAGMGGFVLDGEAADDRSGFSVSGAGDVDGDGLGDVIVGAYGADPNGASSGRSYVVFGKADTTAVQLSAITAGMGGFVLDGEAANDQSGRAVSGAGDVNGDGLDDVIVGARYAESMVVDAGRSYVIYGKADTAAAQLSGIAAGMGGFVLDGEAFSDFSGCAVSGAGDANGDGFADVIVGAQFADPNSPESGRSYVVFGGNFTGR